MPSVIECHGVGVVDLFRMLMNIEKSSGKAEASRDRSFI